jgi:DNA-binding IclR family transcriptional regulator
VAEYPTLRDVRCSNREGVPRSVLSRAFLLLSCFGPIDGELTLTELSRRSGIAKPTVHRLLGELSALGAVEKTAYGYRVGMQLFELGHLAPRPRTIRTASLPLLVDLAEATGETVHLAILEGTDVLYVEKLDSRSGPDLPSRVGGRMPAYCTGLGKAILAFSKPPTVQAVFERGLKRRTPRTIIAPGLLSRELAAVRRTGIAYEYEESTAGVRCTASPVLDASNVAIAAISVAGWASRLNLSRVTSAVRTAALTLSRELVMSPPVMLYDEPDPRADLPGQRLVRDRNMGGERRHHVTH